MSSAYFGNVHYYLQHFIFYFLLIMIVTLLIRNLPQSTYSESLRSVNTVYDVNPLTELEVIW